MPDPQVITLAVFVAGFVAFGATLAFVSAWSRGRAKPARRSVSDRQSVPDGARQRAI